MVANNDVVSVYNKGNVNIQTKVCNDVHQIQVRNVLFIPELSDNLLSVSQLTKNSCKLEFTNEGCNIYNANKVLEGAIDIRYIQADVMVADALTKVTSHSKLAFCSSKMGLCLREDVGS